MPNEYKPDEIKSNTILFYYFTTCYENESQAETENRTYESKSISLKNEHIKVEFSCIEKAWKSTKIARVDGSDQLLLDNDEFEILLFDDSQFTIADYEVKGLPVITRSGNTQILKFVYERKRNTSKKAPASVDVIYKLGKTLGCTRQYI